MLFCQYCCTSLLAPHTICSSSLLQVPSAESADGCCGCGMSAAPLVLLPNTLGRISVASRMITPSRPPPALIGIGNPPPPKPPVENPPPLPRRSSITDESLLRILVMSKLLPLFHLFHSRRRPALSTPRSPTAPAPINGPRPPNRAGVIRALRLNDSWACSSSVSCAELKNVAPKPSATDPPTTARSRSSKLHTVATACPTSRPVRCMISYVGSECGRPVMASIAGPLASASRQPRDPHEHRRPFGSTTVCPTCPALPVAPSSSLPVNTIPPPTAAETPIAKKSERPCAAPSQPSASARALAPR